MPLIWLPKGFRRIASNYLVAPEDKFIPWVTGTFQDGNVVFQQDGAPAHTAKTVQDFLASEMFGPRTSGCHTAQSATHLTMPFSSTWRARPAVFVIPTQLLLRPQLMRCGTHQTHYWQFPWETPFVSSMFLPTFFHCPPNRGHHLHF